MYNDSVRGASPNGYSGWTRYFANKTSWLVRIPPTIPNRIIGQRDIDCPASSTQLTINDRDMQARIFLWLPTGNWTRYVSRVLLFHSGGGTVKDIDIQKNFRISRERRSVAVGYSICEEWIHPHFVPKVVSAVPFLTGILLHAYVKAPPTHSRAHIRERPAFH